MNSARKPTITAITTISVPTASATPTSAYHTITEMPPSRLLARM